MLADTAGYGVYLDEMIGQYSELFPADIGEGYSFHRLVLSGKLGLTTRRIRLSGHGQAYQLRSDPVMPYMILHDRKTRRGGERAISASLWGA